MLEALLTGINPGLLLIIIGVIALFVPQGPARHAVTLGGPLLALAHFLFGDWFGHQPEALMSVFGYELYLNAPEPLAFIFALIFLIAALLNGIYALHIKDSVQDGAGMIYAGGAIAATFAGDFLTLFVYWELTAVSSVFLIWASGTDAAIRAGIRYLIIQVASGVLLLAGATIRAVETGSMTIPTMDLEAGPMLLTEPGALLIFIALGIKAAFPLMHNWLQDAYPKATPTGSVVLSAFTTKLAVFMFARLFHGTDILIYLGAIMTIFPVFFAVIENDLRKVLAYSTNNQVGFMICAIGVGTPLALAGASTHAFADILFKGLLFMSMGAVMHRTGTTKASELGGLYKYMPITAICCIIGAASISAFPLFSGFVTKGASVYAVHKEGLLIVWGMLIFASAGVLEHSGIKIPFCAFFAHESEAQKARGPVREAPNNMLIAMGIAAFFCIFIGVNPTWVYGFLPQDWGIHYNAYTAAHILEQMQLLVAAAFAFVLLQRLHLYPHEVRGVILDFDWTYRRVGLGVMNWAGSVWKRLAPGTEALRDKGVARLFDNLRVTFGPEGQLSKGPLPGAMAVWTAVLLGVVLLLAFFGQS